MRSAVHAAVALACAALLLAGCGLRVRQAAPSAFYESIDLQGLRRLFEPEFRGKVAGGRHETRSAGSWEKGVRMEGALRKGLYAKDLADLARVRLGLLLVAAGVKAGAARPGTEPAAEIVWRQPYEQGHRAGTWEVRVGPGRREGRVRLEITLREKPAP